ncbi:MAG: D-hexose-6-phosphate mutarotase [Burkholderiaceae bacterium]
MADLPPAGSSCGLDEGFTTTAGVTASCRFTTVGGQPALRLALQQGDALVVALQGAQVLSWEAVGRERLFLSPRARLDGHSAIRGGIPVCFPQFNQRGPLVKHGFARNVRWHVRPEWVASDGAAVVSFSLTDADLGQGVWAQRFAANIDVALSPGGLQVTLSVSNREPAGRTDAPLAFTGALHTYLAVDDVGQATLSGLGGQAEWDAVADVNGLAADVQRFHTEFDRVYAASPHALLLRDGAHTLAISQSPSFANTVVWNPGEHLGAQLADMPENGHERMLCVEAAAVFAPVEVAPDTTWQGWQKLQVVT